MTVLNILCTCFTLYGAYKANTYYKRSKQLTDYANTNVAFMEVKNIIVVLSEMLRYAVPEGRRGVSYKGEICKSGEKIKQSIIKIREYLSVEDSKEINNLLVQQEFKVEKYIDSFITGDALVEGKFVVDENYTNCQNVFYEMQLLLKERLEDLDRKIK